MAILSQNFVFFQRLSHLMELFPASFNEKLCEQLLVSFISGFSVTFYITGCRWCNRRLCPKKGYKTKP